MKRHRVAVILNLLLPGTGLILLRREWLGLCTSLFFALALEVGLFSWLLAPLALPFWVQVVAWLCGGAIWVGAQMLVRSRLAFLNDPDLPEQMASLLRRADEAMRDENLKEARGLLRVALTLDDEDVEANVRLADLLTAQGRSKEARRVWRRVSRLDGTAQAATRLSDPQGRGRV